MDNLNIAVIGHVDSGKTSLAKAISTQQSTAGFDKHPESQKRGITIDVGFSKLNLDGRQISLIDCPGHAHFIKTVLCGIYIADCIILVVDGVKLMQQQTYESLIIARIFKLPLIVCISKCGKLDSNQRDNAIKTVREQVQKIGFKDFQLLSYDIDEIQSLEQIFNAIKSISTPDRSPYKQMPLLFHYDHQFQKQGVGNIVTGTIKQGSLRISDNIWFTPDAQARVAQIQSFGTEITEASVGDRVGIQVKQVNPVKLGERGVVVGKKEQFITSKYFLVQLTNYQPTKTYKQNYIFTANFGYLNFQARVVVFPDQDLPKIIQLGQEIQQEYKKEYGFKKAYAILIAVDDTYVSLLEQQKFLLLNLQQGVKQRICMGGIVLQTIQQQTLQKFKQVSKRKQYVEVLKANQEKNEFVIKEIDCPNGTKIYNMNDEEIGTTLQKFGMGKIKCQGIAECSSKYYFCYNQVQQWNFLE